MRRHLRTLALSLACGALATIAVAWLCAVSSNLPYPEGLLIAGRWEGDGYLAWIVNVRYGTGARRIYSSWYDRDADFGMGGSYFPQSPPESLLPSWSPAFMRPGYTSSHKTHYDSFVDSRGWPLLAMWSGCETATSNTCTSFAHFAIPLAQNLCDATLRYDSTLLPLHPHLTGFALNTLLYATLMYVALRAPVAILHALRRRRVLCPACGYPQGNSALCPECGNPVTTAVA